MNVMFTQSQINAIFHTMNNAYGEAFESACTRAYECDSMSRDAFIKAYTEALRILGNVCEEDFK